MMIRILLGTVGAEWAKMLAEIIQKDQELKIVAVCEDPLDLLIRAGELSADVVVLTQLPQGLEPGICSHLLLEHPNLALVLLPERPGRNVLWRLMLRKESWSDADEYALHLALRSRRADPYTRES
ncbi:MAG: hypothetical protein LAO20_05210 [Acidobacteriia bacterium]|nr:hypothetical protein [Terriglobia bacterium]